MKETARQLYQYGVLPAVKIEDAADAAPLANALAQGGLPCVEVTFRSDAAEQAIRNISRECPDVFLGAGTVLNTQQVDRAIDAGAKFIVTPGFNRATVEYCVKKNIPLFPGCNGPASVECAMELGLTIIKFFPAEQSGGIPMIKALSGPYAELRFIPTGGINEGNLSDYLALDNVVACSGTWIAPEDLIAARRFDEITARARRAVALVHGFTLCHVGINSVAEQEARSRAEKVSEMFGFELKDGQSSLFAGQGFEFIKNGTLGEKGHICLSANNISRAYAYLKALGYAFDENSKKYHGDGRLKVANLRDMVGGFVLQLTER